MKKKPIVCVIDEDPSVRRGWEQSLAGDVQFVAYATPNEALDALASDPSFFAQFQCIIAGRFFNGADIVGSEAPHKLRKLDGVPLFINWQGFIAKDDLNSQFDGKLFHRYGVKWQTLRLRVQKFEKCQKLKKNPLEVTQTRSPFTLESKKQSASRPERCSEILLLMAKNATGTHKSRIEFFAKHDQKSGIELLEALYNRLTTTKEASLNCPSRYINSSPVIAKRMLARALYQSEN